MLAKEVTHALILTVNIMYRRVTLLIWWDLSISSHRVHAWLIAGIVSYRQLNMYDLSFVWPHIFNGDTDDTPTLACSFPLGASPH